MSGRCQKVTLIVTGEDYNTFRGSYQGPKKKADLAITFRSHSGALEVKFVLEVGFSESYQQVAREARLLIDGTSTVFV